MLTTTDFKNTIEKFSKVEDTRDEIWKRAEILMAKGYDIEAYLLILATWNFARFRYAMKDFDLTKFETTMRDLQPYFDKVRVMKFETINFENQRENIEHIYDKLAKIRGIEYTGATKIMALKNPRLFVMWDTGIRRLYNDELYRGKKIPAKPKGKDYVDFLLHLENKFTAITNPYLDRSLAKMIDEYNYVKAEKFR